MKTQDAQPCTFGAEIAIRATSQILGEVPKLCVAKTIPKTPPASRPKSDCAPRRPEKYGASMAAKISVWPRERALQRQSFPSTMQPRMRGDDKLMMSGAEQRTAVEHRADAYSPTGLGCA
jgi:hypothetical protein